MNEPAYTPAGLEILVDTAIYTAEGIAPFAVPYIGQIVYYSRS